jgi:hypothetical protein
VSARIRQLLSVVTAYAVLSSTTVAADDQLPKAVGKSFIEAESRSWVKAWLDAHPPQAGITNFGGKTVFVLELLMAADEYAKADTDKQRFHAATSGAMAFVAYSYAATPAVGLVVTAVYLVAQILEGAVAQSYAEAMLAIYHDITLTEGRRIALVQRAGEARGYRLITLADGVQQLIDDGRSLDVKITSECTQPAGDYTKLSECMSLVTQALASREALTKSIGVLLSQPDANLDLLSPPPPATPGAPAPPSFRDRLNTSFQEATKNVDQVRAVYDKMVFIYSSLAAAYLEAEALDGEQRIAAAAAVKATCLVQHTELSRRAATESARIAAIDQQLRSGDGQAVQKASDRRKAVVQLLSDYEERRLGCPEIFSDKHLPELMALVNEQMARVHGL